MRGQSELTNASEKVSTKNGLDTEYITHWSYGIGETWSLLIPNVKGGATGPIAQNTDAMQKADPSVREYVAQIGNHYWGDQPGNSRSCICWGIRDAALHFGVFFCQRSYKMGCFDRNYFNRTIIVGKKFPAFNRFFYRILSNV